MAVVLVVGAVVLPALPAAAEPPPRPPACTGEVWDAEAARTMVAVCGRRVELASERNEYAQTFVNPDGSRTLEQMIVPVRARRGSSWVPIDMVLKAGPDGIAPRASVLPVVFSAGGRGPLARVANGDRELAMTWPYGDLPAPTLEGDTAVYRNVLPDVDLRLTADAVGFSEVLVVRSRVAAADPRLAAVRFGLSSRGVTVTATGAGGLAARDGTGKEVFTSPAPLMWDSSVDTGAAPVKGGSALGAAPKGRPGAAESPERRVVMPVRVEGGGLTIVPDRALLTDPAARLPIFIDPSWKGNIANNAWTTVWSKYANSSFWQNSTALQHGSTSGSSGAGRVRDCATCSQYIIRSLFRMDTAGVRGRQILGATFSVLQRHAWTCSPVSNAKVWLTGPITSATTWNSQPGWNGSYTAQTLGNRKNGAVHGCLGAGRIEFNVTSIVALSVASNWPGVTVGLRAVDEGTLLQWKRFDHTSPYLAINFNTLPNAPTNLLSDGKACATGSARPYVLTTTPTLAANHSDPDTGQQSLATWFFWWPVGGVRNDTDRVGQTRGNPASPSVAIPAGRLTDGATYLWQVYTFDGYTWGYGSGICEFTVDATPPPTPGGVTSTAYPSSGVHGGVGVAGVFNIAAPSTRPSEVVGYAYTLDSGVLTGAPTVPARSTDHGASVTIKPGHDGVNTLRVWSKDHAGRFSATPVVYTFTVKAIAGSGAAAEWTFNEASGSATDVTLHGNTATLSGGATRATGRGGVGKALSLDGVDDYAATSGPVKLPHPVTGVMTAVRTDNSFTATARVRLPAIPTSNRTAVAVDGVRTSPLYLGYEVTQNRWRFRMTSTDTDSPSGATVYSDAAPVAGKWTHLAVVYDANTKILRLYVNGVLQTGSATLTGGFNSTGAWNIGRQKYNGVYGYNWPGDIDDVRVYNFVESAARLAELAVPLQPTVSFPNGTSVTAGGPVSVTFNAGGDNNITKVKYSVDNTGLGTETTVSPAGGAKTVTITASGVVGQHIVYAAAVDDGNRVGPTTQVTFTVTPAASLSGSVIDGLSFGPIEGATVTLNPGGMSTTSDPSGGYAFSGFAPGTYTLAGTFGGRCGLSGSAQVEVPGPGKVWDLVLFPLTDDLGYTCEEQTAAFVVADQTVLPLAGDDAVTAVGLPFAFPFYGQAYRQAWVDTNGAVSFTDPGGSHPNTGGAVIPAPATPNALVAPFWDDLVVDASASVRTATTGSGTGQRFVIEWRNVHRKASTAQRLSFETVLAPDGTVTFNYDGLDTAAERGAQAVVGIEAPAGEDGLTYSLRQPVLASGEAIVFDLPDAGNPITVFDLSGILSDATGVPVVGVPVTLDPSGLSVTTGAGGAYAFTGVVADSYTVSASQWGRCANRVARQVELTADTTLNLQMSPDYGAMGYGCTIGTSGYQPVAQVLPLTGDGFYQLALPFGFTYAGQAHTSTWVSTKALLTFAGNPGFDISDNTDIPDPAAPNAVVAALWDSLAMDASSSVRSEVFGSAPNRQVVVEWRDMYIWPDTAARVTVEVVLHEDGRIVFHYGDLDSDAERGAGATVGLESPTGWLAAQFSFNETILESNWSITYTPAAPGTVSGTLTAAVTTGPVAGATVTLTLAGTAVTRTTTTAVDGGYQFTGVPVGEYVVEASTNDGRCAGQWAREPLAHAGGVSDVDLSVMVDGDQGGYTCTHGAQAFVPGTVALPLDGDDNLLQNNPPFPIQLYGQTFTTAWVDTNGAVAFRQPATSAWDVSPIPSPGAPYRHNAAVYPFWYDWVVDEQASMWQATLGAAPNRRWVVEWRNVHAFGDPNTRVTFEVMFDEATGDITFAYADIDPASPVERGAGATVGIEDASGTIGFQYSYALPRLSSGQGMRFHPNPPAPGGVAGTVTCADLPVSGASVTVDGQTVTTDANGGYTVSNVPAGAHAVVITIAGGSCPGSAVAPVTVGAGSTETVNFPRGATPAGAGYTLAEQAVSFVPADETVLDTLTQADDKYTQVSLPFSVTLYGQSYANAWVDTNGVVSFVDPGEPSPIALPIPSADNTGEPNAAVYPFWHDWVVDTAASVRTATLGTAPNRQFVVEWRNVYSHEDPTTRVSFEVVFDEAGGFTFAYDIDATFLEQGGAATIGIENAAGTVALQYTYRHPVLLPGTGVHITPPTP